MCILTVCNLSLQIIKYIFMFFNLNFKFNYIQFLNIKYKNGKTKGIKL